MIITSTPYRISFFGGGTDYPAWYCQHGGAVLSTTIDRYCNIQVRDLPPFFDHKYRVVWSKIETPSRLSDIEHPSVREAIRFTGLEQGLEIHHFGDLPARSGLGSSSSFTVGILNALNALNGKMASRKELAMSAIHLEQEIIREDVGIQDQIATAYGGFNRIDIEKDGTFIVQPVPVSADRLALLEKHLVLVFTGVSRTASLIAKRKIAALASKQTVLKRLSAMVDDGIDILMNDRDIRLFGELLREGWELKRSITPEITTTVVDDLYETAMNSGAIGGKLLGAGGGGFMLLFIEPDKRSDLIVALGDYLTIPFKFERSGSRISLSD
tara:strand:+ start:888 stop:1868 length:981 start_codon:yes stop_codon:yes gene_type:complete